MKFQKPLFLLLFTIVMLLSSCRKEATIPSTEEGVLRLRLVPEWEGQPLQMFTEQQNVSGYRVQVEKVRFYLGDMKLQNSDTTWLVSPVQLVDFENGPVERLYSVGSGTWSTLSMALGVPFDLNHSDPVLYDNEHPLSVSNSMHWTWETGYIFLKFEGRFDLDPNSSGTFPSTYSIHTGKDTCYTEMNFEPLLPFELQPNDTTTVTIKVAVDRFFHSEAEGTIDLETENMSHGTDLPLSLKLTRNAAASFQLE